MGAELSLTHGWLPICTQLLTAVCLAVAVGWRTRRWRVVWVPVCAALGLTTAATAYVYLRGSEIAGDSAPVLLWVWIGLSGLGSAVLIAGWRQSRWWRRGLTILAVPLSVVCAAGTVNAWTGYLPTAESAWSQLTGAPLPDQTDHATLAVMQRNRIVPAKGLVVVVHIDSSASGFGHRDELVYLPPAWFATTPPPPLPAVMMIGGQFNTPADWLRAGHAITTLDAFADAHGGRAPVFVFADPSGRFDTDTECVNGSRGNAADHLTKDVVPYLKRNFGVDPAASRWAVVGFSAGGTCAVDLAVMHPDLFGSFVDIAGDLGPNSGTKTETIDRLFGGNQAAWQAFDPSTVITRHAHYDGTSGLFVVSGAGTDIHGQVVAVPNTEFQAATQLCKLGADHGIDCGIIALPAKHDWPCAAAAFASTLPWLAAQVGTNGTTRPPPMRQHLASVPAQHVPAPTAGG